MAMDTRLYDKLVEVARSQHTITYSGIAPVVGLDMKKRGDVSMLSNMLNEVSAYEYIQGRPLLSAVVVRNGNGTPGQGFYKLASFLGRYTGGDKVVFFARELLDVITTWKGN